MSVLRFTPPTYNDAFNSTTIGLYSLPFNWSPQKSPSSGDTAILTYGTLQSIGDTISGVSLFALSVTAATTPTITFQDTLLASGTTLVVDSRAGGTAIPLTAAFHFENDGTIDVLGQATVSAFAGNATIVNKGIVNLYDGFLISYASIENDGVITVANSAATPFIGSITGTGSIILRPGDTVETTANVSSGQTFRFTGGGHGNSSLQIDSPASFGSAIAGFSASDRIILANTSTTVSGVTYSPTGAASGVLRIATTSGTDSLSLIGSYTIADFTVSSSNGYLTVTTSRTDQGIADRSPVYRFFDSSNGTHFFTSSASERDQVVSSRTDLVYEGVGLTATDPNGNSATAVYRFFDTLHGTHFYTASASERDSVIANRSDLTFEGTGFYADATQQAGDAAVYRFFDTQYGTHFYTASASEATNIQATRSDLTYEGVSFYSAA